MYESVQKVKGRVLCRVWSSVIVVALEHLELFLSIMENDAAVEVLLLAFLHHR